MSTHQDAAAVAIAFASQGKGIEPEIIPPSLQQPPTETQSKPKRVQPVNSDVPNIDMSEFNELVEENKKLRQQVNRLNSEALIKLPEISLKNSECKMSGPSTKILTLGSGEMRAPRHTFNLSFIDKIIVDVKNEIKIVEQDGKNKINSMNSSFISVKGEIATRISEMEKAEGEKVEGSLTSEKTQTFIVSRVKSYLRSIVTYAKVFRNTNMRFYIHSLHKKLKYISKFSELMDLSKESFEQWKKKNPDEKQASWSYEEYIAKIAQKKSDEKKLDEKKPKETLDSVIQQLRQKIDDVMGTYISTYEGQREDLQKEYKTRLASDQIIILNEHFDKTSTKLSLIRGKLISLYSNEDSIMDIILDSHFITMYVLKAIHFVIILVSLFLTEKIFSEMYMKNVYAENVPPPNLIYMLLIFIAIDFGFVLFLLTLMFLLMYIFQKPSKDFIINGELIKLFLIDYFIFVVLLFIILAIVAVYMQSKKYFRYNTEGLRAIRALKDITMPLAGVLLAVPFFTIL